MTLSSLALQLIRALPRPLVSRVSDWRLGRSIKGWLEAKEQQAAWRPVQITLHGVRFWINAGNPYPRLVRTLPAFNAPLVELVNRISESRARPIRVVDVGAACGDTVALLRERCPGRVSRFTCIEGDERFFALLQRNASSLGVVEPVRAMLAAREGPIASLVTHHAGSATAKGPERVEATTLDSLVGNDGSRVDVLKIDVDGFDGEVICGATRLLSRQHPAVIFEWHPKLALDCGNDFHRAFDTLAAAGYKRFLWFNNTGTFSHFSSGIPRESLDQQAEYLLAVNHRADAHFDVIALPDACPVDDVALAALGSCGVFRP